MRASELERYTVDGVGRVYTDEEDYWFPSVSTVLSMRPTPAALKRWKKNTDNYEEVMTYKQNRGTLVHYDCLDDIMPRRDGEKIIEMWSEDEQSSLDETIENGDADRMEEDREWAQRTWQVIKKVANIDQILGIETFVAHLDVSYAGQFDLLYQDEKNNETVLADLKTSKYVYDKHQLQLNMYRMACPISVDRMEVIRLNPDNQDWKISSSHDWDVDVDELWDEVVDLRHQLEEERMDAILEHVRGSKNSNVMHEKSPN